MTKDLMGYNQIVENALKGVAREALSRAADVGLPGDHHFYITYKTDAPGVHVPQSLREQYPEEITIVIQHQFWDLIIDEDMFSVTLSFGGRKEHLEVPFGAITGFADPSVQFGLQFKAEQTSINENLHDRDDDLPAAVPDDDLEDIPVSVDTSDASADVVVLDRFRKK
ncbi:MAG: hypothetical protein CL569_15235 [Alphaproteobacteria bacterium]|nr:hypothetical protein [Alphaproteobacteria bacterium]|tara:strand:+ start:12598 stop:13101 length:504 start_codon:yes stop_codon:yes gene_type:complete